MSVRQCVAAVLVVASVGGLTACQTVSQAGVNAAVPETQSPDWPLLRAAVVRYSGDRGGVDDRATLVLQNDFTKIYENHGNDRIGDESLYYIGRISYDLRDYFTARNTFAKHREQFPRSEFASTITALEAEMDRNQAAYQQWLHESRSPSSNL